MSILGILCVSVVDGWLYAIGGSNGSEALKYAEQYDPLSNTWTALPPMRLPRSHFAVTQFLGRIYAIGKKNQKGFVWIISSRPAQC